MANSALKPAKPCSLDSQLERGRGSSSIRRTFLSICIARGDNVPLCNTLQGAFTHRSFLRLLPLRRDKLRGTLHFRLLRPCCVENYPSPPAAEGIRGRGLEEPFQQALLTFSRFSPPLSFFLLMYLLPLSMSHPFGSYDSHVSLLQV